MKLLRKEGKMNIARAWIERKRSNLEFIDLLDEEEERFLLYTRTLYHMYIIV